MGVTDDLMVGDPTVAPPRIHFSGNHTVPMSYGVRRLLGRVRAWMLVLPMDAALIMLPAAWHPEHVRASAVLAGLFLLSLSSAGHYRAQLHVSVLDDLPTLLAKLLTAVAVVSTIIALRHQQHAVTVFLIDAVIAIGLVVAGRVLATQLIL